MFIRIVDYVGNPGGGVRFIVEAVAALAGLPDAPRIEFVSDGQAFAAYEKAFRERCPAVAMRRLRPSNNPRLWNHWYHSLPGMTLLPALLRGGDRASLLRCDVPEEVTRDADAVWLPWVHGHRIMGGHDRVVATYHDTIGVEFPGILPPDVRKQAMALESEWCNSHALVSVTSNATAESLERVYGVPRSRFRLIRLCGLHKPAVRPATEIPVEGPWQSQPYLLCPANTSVHKNHEVLLAGYAQWGAKMPLVLTGTGTDFLSGATLTPRARHLRSLASQLQLDDRQVIGLGYVSDDRYFAILKGCHALVMPTLAEGGGSFPVTEATLIHKLVLCSDIPVMRESVEPGGGAQLWFNPRQPESLALALRRLESEYDRLQVAARSINHAIQRTWEDVARDYMEAFQACKAPR